MVLREFIFTLRFGHHHREEPDGSVSVTEPAAVHLEDHRGDRSRENTDPGAGEGHRRTYRKQGVINRKPEVINRNRKQEVLYRKQEVSRSIMVSTLSRASSLVLCSEMVFTLTLYLRLGCRCSITYVVLLLRREYTRSLESEHSMLKES